MFGYIMINKSSLTEKDYETYQAYYCGLCHTLKERHGKIGRLTLTYDMTFLVLLLSALYECNTKEGRIRCAVHPGKKHTILYNPYFDYGADMNIALTYYNLLDNWQDDHSILGLSGAKLLHKHMQKIESSYKRQAHAITKGLKELKEIERNHAESLDAGASSFGRLTGELFVYQEDIWSGTLRKMGFFLGKFIYLMDAFDDLPNDKKHGNYNPLVYLLGNQNRNEQCRLLLTSLMADCAKEFEKLPIINHVQIIRNILYSGVWCRYNRILENQTAKERDKKE